MSIALRLRIVLGACAFVLIMVAIYRIVAPYIVDNYGHGGFVASLAALFVLAFLLDRPQ